MGTWGMLHVLCSIFSPIKICLELLNVRKMLIKAIFNKQEMRLNSKYFATIAHHSSKVLFSNFFESGNFEEFLKINRMLFPSLESTRVDEISAGKKFGECIFELKKRNVIGSDESWKLFTKVKEYESQVWAQLLKSRLSAIT